MHFTIDGKPWELIRQERSPQGWVRLFARPVGSTTPGPHACFTVPQTTGAFYTGGHSFSFDAK